MLPSFPSREEEELYLKIYKCCEAVIHLESSHTRIPTQTNSDKEVMQLLHKYVCMYTYHNSHNLYSKFISSFFRVWQELHFVYLYPISSWEYDYGCVCFCYNYEEFMYASLC